MDGDIAIVGGGPVGLFLALAACEAGLHPIVLEARGAQAGWQDDRSLALSWSSCLRAARVGVSLSDDVASPIRTIHISHAGRFGRASLTAADASIPVLGRVVGYGRLMQALAGAAADVDIRYEQPVVAIEPGIDRLRVQSTTAAVTARIVCIADGGGGVLANAGFASETKDYGVHALVARVRTDRGVGDTAFERFAADGPLALLPRGDGFAVVWTLQEDAARALVDAPAAQFLAQLQTAFGWRAGRFVDVLDRGTHALALRTTQPLVRGRVAVIGNAAQMLHPVAGQGLNLGLRDAWSIVASMRDGDADDPLARYAALRSRDRTAMIRFTDTLAEVFRVTLPGASLVRGAGLEAIDLLPGARRKFARALAVDAGN